MVKKTWTCPHCGWKIPDSKTTEYKIINHIAYHELAGEPEIKYNRNEA